MDVSQQTYLLTPKLSKNIGHTANRGIVIENPNFTVDTGKAFRNYKSKVVQLTICTLWGGVARTSSWLWVDVHKGISTITKE